MTQTVVWREQHRHHRSKRKSKVNRIEGKNTINGLTLALQKQARPFEKFKYLDPEMFNEEADDEDI